MEIILTIMIIFSIIISIITDKLNFEVNLGSFHNMHIFGITFSPLLLSLIIGKTFKLQQLKKYDWKLMILLMLIPYFFAFGSNNNYWILGSHAGIFWILASLLLLHSIFKRSLLQKLILLTPIVLIVQLISVIHLNKKFDTIIAGDIIEHLNNFEGFFLSCKKHLRKDGVVVISTPNPWHWRYLIRSIFGGEIDIVNPEHTTWFCPKTLRQLASRFSFEVIEIEYGSRFNRELFMPLPKGLKHQSFFTALRLKK